MTRIEFTVVGEPKGQPRPRAFARKMGDKFVARVYDDGTAEKWKSDIAIAGRPHIPAAPIEGPVRLDVDFVFPRPKYLMRAKDPAGEIPHTAKPDRDNCEKALLDALKTLGFFRDDSQVCAGEVTKWYAAKNGRPGARIMITAGIDESRPDCTELFALTDA
jgi:Holliday junction resolvase RusA-like endonuclease